MCPNQTEVPNSLAFSKVNYNAKQEYTYLVCIKNLRSPEIPVEMVTMEKKLKPISW